jgi:hypothetical protein
MSRRGTACGRGAYSAGEVDFDGFDANIAGSHLYCLKAEKSIRGYEDVNLGDYTLYIYIPACSMESFLRMARPLDKMEVLWANSHVRIEPAPIHAILSCHERH